MSGPIPPVPLRVLLAGVGAGGPDVLRALLERPWIHVVGVAARVDDAVHIAIGHPPDVALLDAEVIADARRLVEVVPTASILAYCDRVEPDMLHVLLGAGACGYVLSGAPPDELEQRITWAASGTAVLSRDDLPHLASLARGAERSRIAREIVHLLSHELLSPVTVLLGVARTLGRPQRLPSDAVGQLARSAERAGRKLRRLLVDVSAASALDRSEAPIARRAIPIAAILQDVVAHCPEHSRVRVCGETAATVLAHRTLLALALGAVIDNALGFSPAGTPVDVEAGVRADELEVRVRDRGPGIPAELRSFVFEPFAQVDSSDSRAREGLGLGLYMADRIMRAHGGRIELRDDPRGFSVVLVLRRHA